LHHVPTETITTAPDVPQPPHRRKIAAIVLKLGLMSVALLIALLVSEFAVRILRPQLPSWLDVFAASDAPPYTLQKNAVRKLSTGEADWRIYTDAKGFRCADPASAPPAGADTPILMVLGDSYPFGMGVDYEQSFPGVMQKSLDGRYRIINTGVPGYGPTQYRQVLERELAAGMPIKMVVVSTYLGNDFHDCIWNKKVAVTDGILGNEKSLRSFLKRKSHLYRLATSSMHSLAQPKLKGQLHHDELYREEDWQSGDLKRAIEIYRTEIGKIAELCRSRNIPVVGCIIPTPMSVQETGTAATQPADPARPRYDLPAQQARDAFTQAGIPAVDLTAALAAKGADKTFFAWDQHLNVAGNAIAAGAILDALPALKK
jgi:hypothetical protein